jgi:hypothetical protein
LAADHGDEAQATRFGRHLENSSSAAGYEDEESSPGGFSMN